MPPSPIKILMTTDAVGGVWVFTTTLAHALAAHGFRIHLVVLGPAPSAEQIHAIRAVENIDVELTDFALEWLDPKGEDLDRTLDGLGTIGQRVRPDVVHLNSFREAVGPWCRPVLVTAHSCASSWAIACRGAPLREPRWRAYERCLRTGLAAAARWVAPTAALRDQIQAIHEPPLPGRVIWNGIDGIEPGEKTPLVLAAGRLWDQAKNIAVLVAVAGAVEWPIEIAGPVHVTGSPMSREIGGTAARLVGALGREQLIARMQRAAIFAAPALYEPFGLAVLEAAAAGCALLLADIPSFRELWTSAAFFVDPRQESSVRDGLQRLCRDAQLRTELQHAARSRARRYSLARTSKAYAEAYRSLGTASPVQLETGVDLAGVRA